jgi:hypothetical protein
MKCVYLGLALAALATSASAQETIAYTYDVHGRVVQLDHTGSVNSGRQTTYAYDLADNRTALWRGSPMAWLEDDIEGDANELVKVADDHRNPGSGDDVPGPGPAADPADPLFDRRPRR